jgi:hypothetical protein
MTRRVVIVYLNPVPWAPPGIDVRAWRAAMAEDLIDGLNVLTEAESAIAYAPADAGLAASICWPSTIKVPAETVTDALATAAAQGFDQAAILAADLPDLPGLLIGKLLRPLTTRLFAVAPDLTGPGAAGIATRLPSPDIALEFDKTTAASIRAAGIPPVQVGTAPGWRRVRDASAIATLAMADDRAPATSALLRGTHSPF